MSDEEKHNPYQAPAPPQVDRHPAGLGAWLTGYIVLLILGNVPMAGFMFFSRETMRAADPLAPEWSFPARGVFALGLAACAIAMATKRRAGVYAYFVMTALSLPLNLARGLSFGKALISALAPALIMALLVRTRMSAFNR